MHICIQNLTPFQNEVEGAKAAVFFRELERSSICYGWPSKFEEKVFFFLFISNGVSIQQNEMCHSQ